MHLLCSLDNCVTAQLHIPQILKKLGNNFNTPWEFSAGQIYFYKQALDPEYKTW